MLRNQNLLKIIAGLLILMLLGLLYLIVRKTPSAMPLPNSVTQNTLQAPVDLKNPAVVSVTFGYNFRGTIQKILSSPLGSELITDIQGAGIPRFIITPTTSIFIQQPQQNKTIFIKTASVALRPGQKVNIYASYDLQKNTWTILSITIFLQPTASTTTKP